MSCSEICFIFLVIGVNLWNLIGVLISVLCGSKFRIYYSFICLFVVYVGDQYLYLMKKKLFSNWQENVLWKFINYIFLWNF